MHAWLAWFVLSTLSSFPAVSTGQERTVAPAPTSRSQPEQRITGDAGTIVSGSGLSGGVGYRDEQLFGSAIGAEVSAMWSVRGYQLYRARVGLLGDRRHTLETRNADSGFASKFNDTAVKRPGAALYADVRYRSFARHAYYGIGAASQKADISAYKLRGAGYDLVAQWQSSASFGLSARAGILESHVLPRRGDSERPSVDERFDPASVPGFLDPPRYAVLAVGAALDRRDSPRDPRRGVFVGGTLWRYESGGARYDFTRTTLDARVFVEPAVVPGVLALRLLASADHLRRGADVPFFLMQTLGGGETLRAHRTHRWRDRALAHATVEYRWHPHRLVEIAPFVDVAALGPTLDAVAMSKRLYGYGVAVRGHWRGRVLGRLEWANGPEGQRIILSTGPIF